MRRFFVETLHLQGSSAQISGSEARHIKTVLRLKPGDEIELVDGGNVIYTARIHSFLPGQVTVDLIRQRQSMSEPSVQITVAQAYLKDSKMDALIRDLTELGIAAWIPFISERSVPRPDQKRLDSRKGRWQKIAQESLKQCRRCHMLRVEPATSFDKVLKASQSFDLKIIFWENETRPLREAIAQWQTGGVVHSIFLLLGPEGGFSSREVEQAAAYGFQPVSLGPRILRAETATITACALIQYLFGGLG